MEWILLLVAVVFVTALLILYKFGYHENIYRERSQKQQTDLREMVSVSPVKLPFSIELLEPEKNSLVVAIKGDKNCLLSHFTFVNVKELQKAVEDKKYSEERKLIDILNLISVWGSEEEKVPVSNDDEHRHTISCDAMPSHVQNDFELFSETYDAESTAPLVLRSRLTDEECECLESDNDVTTILTVFKASCESLPISPGTSFVKIPSAPSIDECSVSSSTSRKSFPTYLKLRISDQYIETVSGRVFQLKKLYKSGVDHIDEISSSSPNSNEPTDEGSATSEEEYCLVCQENPVTRALLPCRHLCTCKACFSKLELCPICRLRITSYFVVKDEGNIPDVPQTEESDDIGSLIQNEGIWSFIKSIWNAS